MHHGGNGVGDPAWQIEIGEYVFLKSEADQTRERECCPHGDGESEDGADLQVAESADGQRFPREKILGLLPKRVAQRKKLQGHEDPHRGHDPADDGGGLGVDHVVMVTHHAERADGAQAEDHEHEGVEYTHAGVEDDREIAALKGVVAEELRHLSIAEEAGDSGGEEDEKGNMEVAAHQPLDAVTTVAGREPFRTKRAEDEKARPDDLSQKNESLESAIRQQGVADLVHDVGDDHGVKQWQHFGGNETAHDDDRGRKRQCADDGPKQATRFGLRIEPVAGHEGDKQRGA